MKLSRLLAVVCVAAALPLCPAAADGHNVGGRWIAFHADPGGSDDLFLVSTSGSGRRRLTHGLEQIAAPVWSPDGRRLAFLAPIRAPDIYVVQPSGADLRRLTREGEFFDLAWSPDSRRLAAARCRPPKCDLWEIDAQDGSQRLLARNGGQAAWSPEGSRIGFLSTRDGQPELYVMNVDGSEQRRLTNALGEDADPAWRPDGTMIAFASKRTGKSQIYVMRPDGSGQRRLVRDRWNDAQPRWSPDGRRIVFTSYRNRDPNTRGIGNAEIVSVRADGSGLRNLTRSRFWEGDPAWSPDGSRLAYATRRNFGPNGTFRLGVMRADGTRKRLFAPIRFRGRPANSCCPAWQP